MLSEEDVVSLVMKGDGPSGVVIGPPRVQGGKESAGGRGEESEFR